ncbi:TetR/AcrR family transcriptional regulator [Aeromicrobium duanguangcaii]|uniref:TetR/AcrR family transcriptional regulator n=1 Tax=Aeromicrobium duanguangcaii TaxID=2968086 RepID=UPI002016D831|nr:TetR/AcrR family transcriptional regulator [Aeromicrobium duanguangcaii]MCL3837630.1 TetR/AcrR family transcriptional regulator [Aeromicrobium duanguangcaii]
MAETSRPAPATIPPWARVDREHAEKRIEQFWDERASGASHKILRGATLAFADLGFHGASTREIATRSGMSPAAVYIHFESKQELFHRIALEGHRASTSAFSHPARQAGDPVGQLRLGVASFATWNAEMNLLSRSIEYEIRLHRGPEFADVWALRRAVDDHVLEILQDGVAEGAFRLADLEWAKIAILSTCIDVARWYRHGSVRTPTAIGFQYADLAMTLAGAGHPTH